MYGQDLCFFVKYHRTDPESNHKSHTLSTEIYHSNPPSHISDSTESFLCQHISFRNYSNHNFHLINFGTDRVYPGFEIRDRCNNSLTINCVLSGKGHFNGHAFQAGDCYYTMPGQIHTMIADEEDPWVSIWLSVDGTLGKTIADRLNAVSINQILPFYNPNTLQQLTHMYLYEIGFVYNSADFMQSMVQQFLTFLIPDSKEEKEKKDISPRLRMLVNQSIVHIENNIGSVTVHDLAQQAHLEPKYFTRIFTMILGQSPQKYIIKIKMEMASRYLTMTDYSVDRIAEILGYNHRNCLTTPFKKEFGLTPPEYRNKYGQTNRSLFQ